MYRVVSSKNLSFWKVTFLAFVQVFTSLILYYFNLNFLFSFAKKCLCVLSVNLGHWWSSKDSSHAEGVHTKVHVAFKRMKGYFKGLCMVMYLLFLLALPLYSGRCNYSSVCFKGLGIINSWYNVLRKCTGGIEVAQS